MIYAIGVKLPRADGTFTNSYTYVSPAPIAKDSAVVVPVKSWFTVGIVSGCLENYAFKKDIQYKRIIRTLAPEEIKGVSDYIV